LNAFILHSQWRVVFSGMTTCLTFRDVPVSVRDELKRRAKANARSLNAEGVTVLSEALAASPRLPEKELRRQIAALATKRKGLSRAETGAAIREGRK
jgi:hypothetical protein